MVVISVSTVKLTINGTEQEFTATQLTPAAVLYWRAWIAWQGRQLYNPFTELAAKVKLLPSNLQAVVITSTRIDLTQVPDIFVLDAMASQAGVELLAKLVTGKDIKPDSPAKTLDALLPFVADKQPDVVVSLEEANEIRAKLGKPPIKTRRAKKEQPNGIA
jgi:hypothetical protein